MKLTITGTPKEIAATIREMQEWQAKIEDFVKREAKKAQSELDQLVHENPADYTFDV